MFLGFSLWWCCCVFCLGRGVVFMFFYLCLMVWSRGLVEASRVFVDLFCFGFWVDWVVCCCFCFVVVRGVCCCGRLVGGCLVCWIFFGVLGFGWLDWWRLGWVVRRVGI